MKPISGIVTSNKSIPDSFRQLDVFTTDVLNQLWKVYSVNRDVVANGRRLENLFWRVWGSERTGRPFSGQTVSAIFVGIHCDDDLIPPRRRNPPSHGNIKLAISERGQPAPPESATAATVATELASSPTPSANPRASVEIECPPTPPPSPVPNSMQRGCAAFLSKQPQLTEITLSLQRTLHNPPPSPPGPAAPQLPPPPPVRLAAPPTNSQPVLPSKRSRPQHPPRQSMPLMTLDTVQESKASEWVSGSVRSQDSRSSKGSSSTKAMARIEHRGGGKVRRGKKVLIGGGGGRANRQRGIPPPIRRTKSNTTANSPVSSVAEIEEETPQLLSIALGPKPKLESEPEKKEQKNEQSKKEEKRRDTSGGGWIVDPDFRTKYIDKKEKQKEMLARVVRAPATTAMNDFVVTATASSRASTAKGKNILVANEVQPALPRQKSQLTLLLERERRAAAAKIGSSGGSGGGESSKSGQLKGDQGKSGFAQGGQGNAEGKVRRQLWG